MSKALESLKIRDFMSIQISPSPPNKKGHHTVSFFICREHFALPFAPFAKQKARAWSTSAAGGG